jgi:hypothetical protein
VDEVVGMEELDEVLGWELRRMERRVGVGVVEVWAGEEVNLFMDRYPENAGEEVVLLRLEWVLEGEATSPSRLLGRWSWMVREDGGRERLIFLSILA